MFEALGSGMAALINWFYSLTVSMGLPSFGLAIILVTILIKIALHPLTRIQMRSMAQMSQLQPEIRRIQEAYSKDKQKMQQKIMELYKERKVNPMSGCFLLLLQLPILIALYRALWRFDAERIPAEHLQFLWIPDLVAEAGAVTYDPFWTVALIPILAAVSTFYQAKLSMALSAGSGNPAQESMQKMMLTVMPLFIAYITYIVPAGLGLYWVTFNAVGIVQQQLINKQLLGDKPAREKQAGDEPPSDRETNKKAVEAPAGGKPAAAKNPGKKSSAKGRRGKPGKEEVTQGEGGRRKRKKRGGGG